MSTPRRDRKRKGSPEWVRLGEQLADRRADLSPDYEGHGGRAAFARDRDVNLKLIQDIELNARENFTPKTLRDVIAPAYGVTYESIRHALEEGGGLEPATGIEQRPAGLPASLPAAGFDLAQMIPMPEEVREAAEPYARKFHDLYVQAVARTGDTDPAGDEVFPAGSWDAQSWDRLRRLMEPFRRLGVIAVANVPSEVPSGRQHGAAAGLTAEAALSRSGGA